MMDADACHRLDVVRPRPCGSSIHLLPAKTAHLHDCARLRAALDHQPGQAVLVGGHG
jgi:hypothetical protein